MERQMVLSQYDKMRKEINDSKNQYLEALFKYIRSYFKHPKDTWNKELFIAGLEDTIYESLTETYAITAKAVEKIYNIIFTDKIDDDTLVIGHIGRFVEQKNHRFLIDIFNEVHKL